MDSLEWTIVPGFKDEHRMFGEARCIKCTISNIPCAIVVPGRTHHPEEVIEVISGKKLRDELGLNENSEVAIVIE